MYKNMLPIGSVVLLKGGQKRVMIIGRVQARAGEDKIYDYSACSFGCFFLVDLFLVVLLVSFSFIFKNSL